MTSSASSGPIRTVAYRTRSNRLASYMSASGARVYQRLPAGCVGTSSRRRVVASWRSTRKIPRERRYRPRSSTTAPEASSNRPASSTNGPRQEPLCDAYEDRANLIRNRIDGPRGPVHGCGVRGAG
jgi:hypothetical protein